MERERHCNLIVVDSLGLRRGSDRSCNTILEIVSRAVDFHRANIIRKLGAGNIAELVGKILTIERRAPPPDAVRRLVDRRQ
jgi:FixJ family two-component response regulator